MLGFRCLALCCMLLAALTTRAENSTPLALLENMSRAGQTLSYRGSFTYEHSASMESFRILHWVEDGQTHEYLEYLNGPDNALQRLGVVDGCQTVGLRLIQSRGAQTEMGEREVAHLNSHYQIQLRGEDRIAGRSAQVLEVRPRDELRYGYVLGLDRETGLLLKSVLIDEQQRVLERFQFVDLDLDSDPESLRKQAGQRSGSTTVSSRCATDDSPEPSRWSLSWLPPGFAYSGERQLADDIEMLMYTDGLASFSVFLQPDSGSSKVEGWAQRGATSAYMGRIAIGSEHDGSVEEYRVTVVGEIPGPVAQELARGVGTLSPPRQLD